MCLFFKKTVELVYDKKFLVENVFVYPNRHINTPVSTMVLKHTKGRRVRYEIKQFYDLIPDAFFDGEKASNRMIQMVANNEKRKAEMFIEKMKANGNRIVEE